MSDCNICNGSRQVKVGWHPVNNVKIKVEYDPCPNCTQGPHSFHAKQTADHIRNIPQGGHPMTATPNTAALQALLERVEAGTLGSGDILTAEECKLIYACFPAEIEGVWASEWVSLAMDGSIDAAKALIAATCPGAHQVTADWGPSGCGAKLVWWPDGLSDGREIASDGYDVDPARAMLGAVIRAMIADTEGR